MTKVVDFDAFRAEQKVEPVVLRLGGKDYELPSSLPASLALDIIRMNSENGTADVPPDQLAVMGQSIFGGGDLFNRVLTENGITMAELADLFRLVFAAYNSGAPEDPNPASPSGPDTEPTDSSTS